MAQNTTLSLTKPLFSGRALNRTMLAKVFSSPPHGGLCASRRRRQIEPLPRRLPRRTPVGRLAALPPHLRQTEHNDVWRWWRTKQLWIPTAFISPDSNERPNRKDEILLTFFGKGKSSSSSSLLAEEMPSIYFKNGDGQPQSQQPALAALAQRCRLVGHVVVAWARPPPCWWSSCVDSKVWALRKDEARGVSCSKRK